MLFLLLLSIEFNNLFVHWGFLRNELFCGRFSTLTWADWIWRKQQKAVAQLRNSFSSYHNHLNTTNFSDATDGLFVQSIKGFNVLIDASQSTSRWWHVKSDLPQLTAVRRLSKMFSWNEITRSTNQLISFSNIIAVRLKLFITLIFFDVEIGKHLIV